MGRPESLPLLFQTLECCLCSFFTHCQFPTEVLWDPLHRLSWVANILVTASFYKCSRTNSFWPKLPYDFGVDTTTSGCGRFCPSTYKSNFWALEQALIQLWQPQLNTPFIYQFFICRKGLITRTKFSSSRQFGTFSLWRKLRWKSTPQQVRRALHSPIFCRRVQLWEIFQDLGSNSIKRFHMEKRLRSNEIGSQGRDATSFDVLPTTLENPNDLLLSMLSTGP